MSLYDDMSLSEENLEIIRRAARDAGDSLKGRLPGIKRNSYAHIWERLKFHLGKSYKDCDDVNIDEILRIIEWYKNNPV